MKLKNILFYSIASILALGSFVSAVNVDSQIEDELNKKEQEEMIQKTQDLTEKITFTKVNSCQDMEKVMEDFLETYKKLHPKIDYDFRIYRKGDMYLEDGIVYETNSFAVQDVEYVTSDSIEPSKSLSVDKGEVSDYSTTNIQKMGVDEPEILKSNGKYLFYYSEVDYDDKYISIIKTPVKEDLSDAEIVTKINIPNSLHNVQLFLNGDKLIVLGSRYISKSNSVLGSNRTLVIIYDITDVENLQLEKLIEVYGEFKDARMIDDQIYLISSISLSWYSIARSDDPIDFDDMQPKLTDITLEKSSELKDVYNKKISLMPCNSIFYLLPSEDTLKKTNAYPNFTLISQISLSNLKATPKQNLVFGNVNEIHMSQTSLYLPTPIYFSNPIKCSHWGCYSSWYYRDENTLVHKFNLGKSLSYQDSTIIPGTPLNQYSMDEDNDGNFRILTTTWYNQRATHLSILDDKLKIKGSLLNIEPGENFKSSRYIGNKLYLVTFQNIDPLFVVDMEDITNPKIIGELKIPGYSTYLHPYSEAKNGVQYLIGLGYSTTDNGYGGLKQDNTKVDLYKIDYNGHETAESKCGSLVTKNVDAEATDLCTKVIDGKRCNQEQKMYEDCLKKVNPDNIAVSLISSYEFTGDSSYSPALDNPRVFVRRSNKHELVLPMVLSTILEKGTRENNRRYNYDIFLGLKGLSINASTALIKEILSQNFVEDSSDADDYRRDFYDARVGYIDDIYYFLIGGFAGFLNKDGNVVTLGSL